MFQKMGLRGPVCVLDLETAGTDPRDRIVEVAVLRLAPRKAPASFVRQVNPEAPIPPTATAVHGLTDEGVSDRPPYRAIAECLTALLGRCDLAGFGLRRFDLPCLRAEFAGSTSLGSSPVRPPVK